MIYNYLIWKVGGLVDQEEEQKQNNNNNNNNQKRGKMIYKKNIYTK